jgi:hypothetical protein
MTTQRSAVLPGGQMAIPAVRETAPLSPGQERLINSEFILPDGRWPAHGQPHRLRPVDTGAVLVNGDLDVDTLQAAVAALIRRQSALRTTFRFPEMLPAAQLVTASGPRPLAVHRIPAANDDIPGDQLRHIASQTPVNPTGRDLFTVQLIRLNGRRHVVILQIHHLISDGWSIGVLYRELSELYNALAERRDPGLAPLPRTFAQVCASMHHDRESTRMTRQLRFWAAQLQGPWPQMQFTATPPGPCNGSTRVDSERVRIPRDLVRDLRAAGQAAGQRGGLAGPILAALAASLYAQTGQPDVRVGTMIANRAHVDVEHLIGYFVNIAVMRIHVGPNLTMERLVASANATVAASLDNQEVPIQDVLQHLRRHCGLADTPLYQVTLALNTMRSQSLTLASLDCTDIDIESSGPRLAPTTIEQRWLLEDHGGELRGTLTYKTGTFTKAGIHTCLRNLDRALHAIMATHRTVADVIGEFEPYGHAGPRLEA